MMKGTNGFRFYGFQVRKRLSFVLFWKGRGEVVVDDAGCTVEIKSARFFLAEKKRGREDGNDWPCMVWVFVL
jgi:hypothetical protein